MHFASLFPGLFSKYIWSASLTARKDSGQPYRHENVTWHHGPIPVKGRYLGVPGPSVGRAACRAPASEGLSGGSGQPPKLTGEVGVIDPV